MKRLLAAAVLLCMLLCACGASAENTAPATPDTASAAQKQTEKATEGSVQKPTQKPTEPPTVRELTEKRVKKIMDADLRSSSASISVEAMDQYPELPTGCESVALTMAINALGYDLEKTEIAEKYLIYDDNFAIGYCGDPFSDDGAGIWPIGIVATVDAFAQETGAKVCAYNTSKSPLKDLCKLVDAGYPVVVWTTYYMCEPMYSDDGVYYDDEYYMWYDNEHCVTLYGYDRDAGTVDIADPLRGKVTVDAGEFERLNEDIGGYSAVIVDTSDLR